MNRVFILILSLTCVLFAHQPLADSRSQLYMFEEEYCSWCELWNKEIGVVYGITPQYCQAPLQRIDIGETLPDSISLKEPVIYTPTFVLTVHGEEVDRIVGYPGEDFFWPMLDDMIANSLPKSVQLKNASQCKNS